MTTTSNSMLSAAQEYAEKGLAVFPCGKDKAPYTPHGHKDASTDPDQIRSWWSTWPDANVGYKPAGAVVIDLDPPKMARFDPAYEGYDDWSWEASYGPDSIQIFFSQLDDAGRYACLESIMAKTPRGGLHIYLADPDGQFRCTTGMLAPSIDTKSDKGYVLLPPSQTIYKTRDRGTVRGTYEWVSDPLGQTELKVAPRCLVEWFQSSRTRPAYRKSGSVFTDPRRTGQRLRRSDGQQQDRPSHGLVALDRECEAVRTAPDGTRNDTLNRAAFSTGTLIGAGRLDAAQAALELYEAAVACGLAHHEVVATIRSGFAAGVARPRNVG